MLEQISVDPIVVTLITFIGGVLSLIITVIVATLNIRGAQTQAADEISRGASTLVGEYRKSREEDRARIEALECTQTLATDFVKSLLDGANVLRDQVVQLGGTPDYQPPEEREWDELLELSDNQISRKEVNQLKKLFFIIVLIGLLLAIPTTALASGLIQTDPSTSDFHQILLYAVTAVVGLLGTTLTDFFKNKLKIKNEWALLLTFAVAFVLAIIELFILGWFIPEMVTAENLPILFTTLFSAASAWYGLLIKPRQEKAKKELAEQSLGGM